MKPRSVLILLLSAIFLGACSGQAQPARTAMPAKATPAPAPAPTELSPSEPTQRRVSRLCHLRFLASRPKSPSGRPTSASSNSKRWSTTPVHRRSQLCLVRAERRRQHYGRCAKPSGDGSRRRGGLRIVPSIQNAGFNREAVAAIIHDPARHAQQCGPGGVGDGQRL